MGNVVYVGIAEIVVSNKAADSLVAANLGSCLGIVAYDKKRKIGGLVHCLLPISTKDPEKAKNTPCMFVDTGLSELLNRLLRMGSETKDIVIGVAGGASINDQNSVFEIGKKNYTIFKKVLWKNNLLLSAEDVGGDAPRTVIFSIASGEVIVKSKGNELKLI